LAFFIILTAEYELNQTLNNIINVHSAYHLTKPNAVIGVTNDWQNISSFTQEITYNAFNKAASIEENAYQLNFTYGHDKQRRKTLFTHQNAPILEKYFVGLYEIEIEGTTTRHINYVMAGDGVTALIIQEEENGIPVSPPSQTYFMYKDHLGSIVALTDAAGDVVFEQSFDAWGRYRNPEDWTYDNITESPTWLRGYTGHEHLPHFDLINMNGRIYDPILGRMLSPDRFVPDPLSTQGYNRYSYVFNNPLRYTDPSGDLPVLIGVAIGSVIGGYIGGAVMSQNFNIFSADYWNDGWQGFVGGAIIGGLTGGAAAKAGLPAAKGKFLGMSKTGAKNFSSSMLSGIQNTLYQYDADQGFGWHSLAHFAVGFGGSFAGIGSKSTATAFFAGGIGNSVTNMIYYRAAGFDYEAYDMLQWFIGGGLTSYNGAKGAGMGNWKNEEYIFGKWYDYALDKGIQSLASDFAYDNYQEFFDKPFSHHVMTFGRGVMGAGFETVAGYNHGVDVETSKLGQTGRQLLGMTLYAGAYSLEYAMYGLQEAGGNNVGFYSGGAHQKVGVFSHKMLFYSLGIY
jgi:RHS repeat-associated protein